MRFEEDDPRWFYATGGLAGPGPAPISPGRPSYVALSTMLDQIYDLLERLERDVSELQRQLDLRRG